MGFVYFQVLCKDHFLEMEKSFVLFEVLSESLNKYELN
jgi:hypothetical protein